MNERLIENLATILAITALLGSVVLGPVGRALARRLEGHRPAIDEEALRSELSATQGRLQDLEERVDFAERLLAGQREPERLSEGR